MATVERPLGFPRCAECYWLRAGSSDVCYRCASAVLTRRPGPHCPICSQRLQPDGTCKNFLCSFDDLSIESVASIAVYTDPLARAIKRLKYEQATGWALIFGRLVHGWLNEHIEPGDVDLIIPNPTYSSPGQPPRQHTELIIQAAAQDDLLHRWPFDQDPWVVTKLTDTPRSATGTWRDKRDAARAHASALSIRSGAIQGRRVLVFDDVCTTLLQQEHVAQRLRQAGASSVKGLVLARAEF